jgi:hypothetical protein
MVPLDPDPPQVTRRSNVEILVVGCRNGQGGLNDLIHRSLASSRSLQELTKLATLQSAAAHYDNAPGRCPALIAVN